VNEVPMEVEHTWMHGDHLILKFKGIDTISDAEKLAGAEVAIPFEQRAALVEDEVYQSDLIGCEVVDASGRSLGVVSDFQETGGAPLLTVKTPDGRELLIPFAKSICTKIDLERKQIRVNPPEGLLDLN
jgi:16S rRNA processing protein RimM